MSCNFDVGVSTSGCSNQLIYLRDTYSVISRINSEKSELAGVASLSACESLSTKRTVKGLTYELQT